MKRRWSRTELFLIGTPLLVALAALLSSGEPLSWKLAPLLPRETGRSRSCQGSLKVLGTAFVQYAKDFDQKLPPARIGGVRSVPRGAEWAQNPPVGWVDSLAPYIGGYPGDGHNCPSAEEKHHIGVGTPNSRSSTHFWFNGNLSGKSRAKLQNNGRILLCGDGNDGKEVADGTYSKTSLPSAWLSDYSSPSYRHLGGANYLFVDGHVKWLTPREISTAPGARYTFSIR